MRISVVGDGRGRRLVGLSGALLMVVASVLVPIVRPALVAGADEGWSPVDFSGWHAEGGSSRWVVGSGGASVTQAINGQQTYFVSDPGYSRWVLI